MFDSRSYRSHRASLPSALCPLPKPRTQRSGRTAERSTEWRGLVWAAAAVVWRCAAAMSERRDSYGPCPYKHDDD